MNNDRPWHHDYSRFLRVWHWATFLVVLAMLFTVAAAWWFLEPRESIALIRQAATQQGAVLPDEAARNAAGALEERIWELHTILGYVLSGLFVLRIIGEFFQPKSQRLATRIRTLIGLRRSDTAARGALWVQLIYAAFYLLLAGIAGTGLWLAFNEQNSNDALAHDVKELHEKGFWLLLVFIAVHLAGVIRAEFTSRPGVVSRMINGKREP